MKRGLRLEAEYLIGAALVGHDAILRLTPPDPAASYNGQRVMVAEFQRRNINEYKVLFYEAGVLTNKYLWFPITELDFHAALEAS